MSYTIQSQRAGDVAILQCHGRIVRGESLVNLRNAVTQLQKVRIVVLDFSGVETIDGGGLGMLVLLRRWTADNGTQLKLVNPNAFVREMLDRTHLTGIFDISSVEDAVEILCDEVAALPALSTPQFAVA
jgi:anti-anti-sigma factor